MSQLGDPATRPEEDTCFIPTSYAIDEELREWSETAVVSWAAHAPPTTEPRDVEQAFLDEFKLRRGEVAVSLHHPQAFLIKFQHRRHCEEALAKGYVKRHGIEIHFIKWRSLESALGVALMFRVRLCLDGVPMHAWAADIAERIIGRTCALEQIETDVVHPVESGNTRSIDLWAWTANPSTIPKRMWLGFTKRAKDPNLAPLFAVENPLEHWQRGVRHPVLFHLEEIHDYTAATIDLEGQGSFQPAKRRLPPWSLGVLDGEQVPGRVFEDFPHHPPPPRSVHERTGRLAGQNAGLTATPSMAARTDPAVDAQHGEDAFMMKATTMTRMIGMASATTATAVLIAMAAMPAIRAGAAGVVVVGGLAMTTRDPGAAMTAMMIVMTEAGISAVAGMIGGEATTTTAVSARAPRVAGTGEAPTVAAAARGARLIRSTTRAN